MVGIIAEETHKETTPAPPATREFPIATRTVDEQNSILRISNQGGHSDDVLGGDLLNRHYCAPTNR